MSAPEQDPKEWKFRALGRVLFRLPRHVTYLIILGLSIGFGLRSPDEARMIVGGAVQKLLLELQELRVLLQGLTRQSAPSSKRRQSSPPLPMPREGWMGEPAHQMSASQDSGEYGLPIRRATRMTPAMCSADAERLRGNSLRLREAPCSTSTQRRSALPGTGAIRPTGRYTYCRKHGVWWPWVEVLYQDEPLWAARYYLKCFG